MQEQLLPGRLTSTSSQPRVASSASAESFPRWLTCSVGQCLMDETIVATYIPVWLAFALGYPLLFWRRSPEFTKRWYRRFAAFHITVVGGMIAAIAFPHFPAFLLTLTLLLICYVTVFQTRVGMSCGKVSLPENLTARAVCKHCGAQLE